MAFAYMTRRQYHQIGTGSYAYWMNRYSEFLKKNFNHFLFRHRNECSLVVDSLQ